MNARSIFNYVAWHLGIRPELTRSSARITYMGSRPEKGPTPASSVNGAATREADGGHARR